MKKPSKPPLFFSGGMSQEWCALMKQKDKINTLIQHNGDKMTCSAHPLLIEQLNDIKKSMDRNFHKLFQKMEELEKKDIIEDTHKKIKKEAQDKKDKNSMIVKERLIGAVIGFIFTLIFSLIAFFTPL